MPSFDDSLCIWVLVELVLVHAFWHEYGSGKFLERNIFVWGAANESVTTGILLLRVVDPEFKSRTLEDAAMALVANRPIVIALTAFPPIMICSGMAGLFTWICIGGFIVLLLAARIFKWWNPGARPFINKDKEEMV